MTWKIKKTKTQLIEEIAELRKRCAALEITANECKQLEAETQDAREYAENIVETVREPLAVLNAELKILTYAKAENGITTCR